MQRKSILILTDSYPPEGDGGAERIAAYSAEELQRRGHKVRVVTFSHIKNERSVQNGIEVTRIVRKPYPYYWRVYRNCIAGRSGQLIEQINEFKPDIVKMHNVHRNFGLSDLSYIVSRYPAYLTLHDVMYLRTTKVVPTDQNEPESQYRRLSFFDSGTKRWYLNNPLYFSAFKKILSQAKPIAVSRSLARYYETNGVAGIRVVHNGVPNDTAADADDVTASFKPPASRYILHIGRLSESKGTHTAVEAHSKLAGEFPDLYLVLAGDAASAEQFRKRSQCPERVLCAGWVKGPQAKSLYENAVCVTTLSGYLDPFPTTNLEAAHYGCPAVVSCFGGSSEAVFDGRTGIVVNPYRTSEVVSAIRRLLMDPDLSRTMGRAARERYEKEFTIKAYGDRLTKAMGIS